MLLFKSFSNAREFREVFGPKDNGNKARKNKILLGCLKDMEFVRMCARDEDYKKYLAVNNMADFKRMLLEDISQSSCQTCGFPCSFRIGNACYHFNAPNMEIDNHGLCEDGDASSIRYYYHERERYYKMRGGKFFTRLMEGCEFGRRLPQQAKSWLGEEFLTSWLAYSEPRVGEAFEFHYGNAAGDFEEIYSSRNRRGDFHSCMTDKRNHSMYHDACKCHAAWLTDADGLMFARCVVFDEVFDETTGTTLRLAERQYSDGAKDKFKKMLVDALVSRGLIDGYKQIGADCSDNQNFVLNDGTSICDHSLGIRCALDGGDTVSYMDSFVYYDRDDHMAYNYDTAPYTDELNTTAGELENDHENDRWSNYHDEYIPENVAYYVDARSDFFYENEVVVDADGDYQFEDDCEPCADCGEYKLREEMAQEEGLPDDLFFCCGDCAAHWASEHGYVWSYYSDSYLEESDTVKVNRHRGYGWDTEFVAKDDFDYFRDEMRQLDGEWYWLETGRAVEAYKDMTLPALVVA